jgi:hypothetical protein
LVDHDTKTKPSGPDDQAEARREFLKKIRKGSATLPAAVLLIAASSQLAAQSGGGSSSTSGGACI